MGWVLNGLFNSNAFSSSFFSLFLFFLPQITTLADWQGVPISCFPTSAWITFQTAKSTLSLRQNTFHNMGPFIPRCVWTTGRCFAINCLKCHALSFALDVGFFSSCSLCIQNRCSFFFFIGFANVFRGGGTKGEKLAHSLWWKPLLKSLLCELVYSLARLQQGDLPR